MKLTREEAFQDYLELRCYIDEYWGKIPIEYNDPNDWRELD